jgi:membrane associated rhomboid family serine protease
MTPWVLRLIIANVAVFLLTASQPGWMELLALWPRYILVRPWGIFTYMFVHGGTWHLLFNMLALFFFGPRLEIQLGGKSFLSLFLLSGLGGAAFSFLFAPFGLVVGASGAVFGVLLGFAYFWPKEKIYIWMILPVEARLLVGIMTAISLYSGITGTGGGVAHFAHLGGFAAGYAYLRWRKHKYLRQWKPGTTPKAQLIKSTLKKDDRVGLRRWKAIDLEKLHELNRGEVERLLAKAIQSGAGSLTPVERAMLDRFSTDD